MAGGKKFQELSMLTAEIAPEAEPTLGQNRSKSAPGQMMSFATQRDEAIERAEKAEKALSELLLTQSKAGFIEIPLERCHKVPGRQRILTSEQRAELKENLRQHKLATPISLEAREDGDFDIISGNNRWDLYVELNNEFGDKPTIKAVIDETISPIEASELAFYANLLHPGLPAYEKYLGLKMVMNKDANSPLSYRQVSARTGISLTVVSELMSFEKLPAEAIELLQELPSAMGPKTASNLAALFTKGHHSQVIEAVRRLVKDGITEIAAVEVASTTLADNNPDSGKIGKKIPVRAVPTAIKSGRATFCTILGTKKILRVDFESEADRVEVEALVKRLLEEQAERRKQAKA